MCDVDADFEALLNDSGMVSPTTAAAGGHVPPLLLQHTPHDAETTRAV